MEHGDISNEVVPRVLLVFENLVGTLPGKAAEARAHANARLGRWRRVIDLYEVNQPIAIQIWDLTWRHRYSVDLITFTAAKAVEPLRAWVDQHDLPLGHVTYENPATFARKLAYLPHVAALLDPDPAHRFTWGHKGRIVGPDGSLTGALTGRA